MIAIPQEAYTRYKLIFQQYNKVFWDNKPTYVHAGPITHWNRYFQSIEQFMKGAHMAKRKHTQTGDWRFINRNLTKDEKDDAINKGYMDVEGQAERIWTALVGGYKLTQSYNLRSDAVQCTITARDETSVNGRMSMSSLAGTPVEAIAYTLYKHFELANGSSWAELDGESQYG